MNGARGDDTEMIQKDKCCIFYPLCRSLFHILRWKGFPAQSKAGLAERENRATETEEGCVKTDEELIWEVSVCDTFRLPRQMSRRALDL